MKKIKLHHQILIALFLGAVFGSVFNVSSNSLTVRHTVNGSPAETVIKDWQEVVLAENGGKTIPLKTQLDILAAFKTSKADSIALIVRNFTSENQSFTKHTFTGVTSLSKVGTIATKIKWIGDIFIRLLSMIAVPLVVASLTVGAASLGDIKKFARIGGKTMAFYISTTAFAITIGIIAANLIQPGNLMPQDTKDKLLSVYTEDVSGKIASATEYDIVQEIVNIVPKNPLSAMAGGEMLQIVFFSLLLGLVLSMISRDKAGPVISFFDGLSEAMIKLVDVIMYMAPLGVFALIAATVGEFGFDILQTLLWYALTVLTGLALHTFGVYSMIIKFLTRLDIKTFFKGIRQAQTIAFTTSSSAATLPVNIECCQKNLGVSKSVTGFVLPLGATINMDGTALYQGVAAVFIAQVFGIELSWVQQLTIVFTATLASIGTAPVPGVGIIMLIIILKSVGIPEEGIALIMGVDRILDMCRTVTNITGDAVAAVFVAGTEGEIRGGAAG